MLAQNHLSNPIGQPQINNNHPSPMTHNQISMAAQQQLAPLQQQQQDQLAQTQAMQAVQNFQQSMMPNQHLMTSHLQNSQLNPQIQAQLRQLAQANLARAPGQNHPQMPNASQASILARAQQAQNQLTQAQNAMGQLPGQQILDPTASYGSPQPPQQSLQPNPSQPAGVRIPPDSLAQFKITMQRITTMTDQQREHFFVQVR